MTRAHCAVVDLDIGTRGARATAIDLDGGILTEERNMCTG
jgi:ribulose kinase